VTTESTLQISHVKLAFDSTQVGHASKKTDVIITNPGPGSSSVTASVTKNDTEFKIVTTTCDSGPLHQATQCVVTLSFEPQKDEGERFGQLTLHASGATAPPPISLQGQATPPGVITFSPASPFFNLMWTGTKPAATKLSMSISIINKGGGTVTVRKISVDDTTAHFSVSA